MAAVTFRPYGLTHWILRAVTVDGGVLLVGVGRR